ncbi:MAG: type VI secretion lipoprotein TssJ [Candidatus Accumulibacter sp.]|jgi:type VI secretion system VasD/TssJ family lipoprotein|nr:type VI secretion lipoprotein TssJ [Accumulibacter sp.]
MRRARGRRCRRAALAALSCSCLLAACGGGAGPRPPVVPPPAPVEDPARVSWAATPRGITLNIQTSSDLNEMEGVPLGLSLCVYQVDEINRFTALAQTAAGLDTLQACSVETIGAASARRFWLQPGQRLETDIDRAANAKNLALVAGYAHLKPELSVATFAFLLHSEKEGYIPFFRKTLYSVAHMDIVINLTAQAVSVNGVERGQ